VKSGRLYSLMMAHAWRVVAMTELLSFMKLDLLKSSTHFQIMTRALVHFHGALTIR
jgi:hypothetical protein